MNVFYVFSARYVGDTCPVLMGESEDELLTLLVQEGWQNVDGTWIAPRDAKSRQVPLGKHGVIGHGMLENGFVVPDGTTPDQVDAARLFHLALQRYAHHQASHNNVEAEYLKTEQHHTHMKEAFNVLEEQYTTYKKHLAESETSAAQLEEQLGKEEVWLGQAQEQYEQAKKQYLEVK